MIKFMISDAPNSAYETKDRIALSIVASRHSTYLSLVVYILPHFNKKVNIAPQALVAKLVRSVFIDIF